MWFKQAVSYYTMSHTNCESSAAINNKYKICICCFQFFQYFQFALQIHLLSIVL